MSGGEVIVWVDEGRAATGSRPWRRRALLLLTRHPPPEIVAVAADGDVMPWKSHCIHPKALTGLVIKPLE